MNKVNYICIGMMKSGTSWLYYMLKKLPDFNKNQIKEIHFFDMDCYHSPTYKKYFFQRLFDKKSLIRMFKIFIKYLMGKASFHYMLNIVFSKYNNKFYKRLFQYSNKIQGDITPAYSTLDLERIKKMYLLCPEVKIIYIIRDPIERSWSAVRSELEKTNNFDLEDKLVLEMLFSQGNTLRSNAIRTIDNYQMIFPKSQFRIFYYDDLIINPQQFLSNIVKFIGGNEKNILKYCDVKSRSNVSKKIEIPEKIYIELKEYYKDMITELKDRYGGHCLKWYQKHYN